MALFNLRKAGTTVRTEVLAGLTTWLTMVYIVALDPHPGHGAVFVATCLDAGIASIFMGLYASYPLALAPGMGLNAYFAFDVVDGMQIPWQVALGAVFLSGVLFLIVSLLLMREWLINSIPLSLKLGIGAGIGFFLALIGLEHMGVVVASPATYVTLGHLDNPAMLLACAGFLVMAALAARGIAAAMLTGILVTGIPFGLTRFQGLMSLPPSLSPTLLQMDIPGALSLGIVSIVLTFLKHHPQSNLSAPSNTDWNFPA